MEITLLNEVRLDENLSAGRVQHEFSCGVNFRLDRRQDSRKRRKSSLS